MGAENKRKSGQNGKNSDSRVSNIKKFNSNFDEISWESQGTKMARETRSKSNKLTKEERQSYLKEAFKILDSNAD